MRHAFALIVALAATARADVVRLLDDPREAVQARVDVIQQATAEINLLYFLARDDRVTLGVLALLRDAKRRGVGDVRVIVDGSFHRIPKAVLAHLRDEGVDIRVYHPLNLRHPSWMLRRMHEKVIVADSARYIIGGRNLGEAYFGLASKKNYVDRDVYVDGASAADVDQHFEDVWSSEHVAKLRVRVSEEEKQRAAKRLGDVLGELECSGGGALDTGRDWSADRKDAGAVRRRLVRAGVDFREYKGPDALHAKSIVVDGRVSLIGSYNIDPRSQYLNTEVMCMSEDEEIAREVRQAIEAHLENAWTIHRNARGPRISRAESLRIWAARLLLPLIEHQL